VKHEFITEKYCAPNCTVSCVHQTSFMDFWRAPQTEQGFRPRPRKTAAPSNGAVQQLVNSIQPLLRVNASRPGSRVVSLIPPNFLSISLRISFADAKAAARFCREHASDYESSF